MRCDYCGQSISPDPTDSEDWVHTVSNDAQCIVDGVKLDAYAKPIHEHDPEPWLSYTMQTGSAGGWRGSDRFAPREGYCQDQLCYAKARKEAE